MASSRYLFTLDLHTTYSQITLPVTAGDTDRELVMCFSDGDRPYLLTESSVVSISFEYPGGATTVSYGCVIDLENNAAHFEFDENTCANAGVYTVQVRLTDGATNRVVAAPKFELEASGIITGTDAPEISPGDQIFLDQIFGQEANRQKQELDRQEAEATREVNEKARIANESKRSDLYNEIFGKLERGELKGEKGLDGVSPILTPTKKDYGYEVSIKDKEGTKIVSLFDGKDGERGKDGVSVTHTWGGVDNTVLYVTSASGTSAADLKGAKGDKGDRGDGIDIVKSYPSIAAMMSGYASDGVPVGKFVVISTGNMDDEENARLYVKTETEYMYLTDLSGAQGIRGETGETGNGIQRAEVNTNSELVITYTNGDVRNLGSIKGDKGDKGEPQETIQVYVEPSYTMDIVLNALQNAGRNISVFNRVKLSGYLTWEVEIRFRHFYNNTYFVESVIVDTLGICLSDQFDVTTKSVGAFFNNNYSLEQINTTIKSWHGLNEVKGLWELNYSITKPGLIGGFGVNFTSYDPMNYGMHYNGVSFGSESSNQLTYTRNGPSATVYSFDEERWYDSRFQFINVLEEPNIFDPDAEQFVNWLRENGTKLPNEYQLKEDWSLETFNKDVASAINEVNGRTVDKIVNIDTLYDDVHDIYSDNSGIGWRNECGINCNSAEFVSTIYFKTPIVAGDNVTFTVDEENQVVKIGAENTVDKITTIDTWYGSMHNVVDTGGGISWYDEFALQSDGSGDIATGEIYHKIPLVAGENVSFEVDEENQVVKINAAGGLPEVSEDDNGKFLRVVGGSWATALVPNAEGATF